MSVVTSVESPGPLAFDYVDSHARLRGDEVELVLCGLDGAEGATSVVLSRDGSRVAAPADVRAGETTEVRARTPRSGLGDGEWSIALEGGSPGPVDGRLLVQGARPVVLLLGATAPRSVVPRPRPVPAPLSTRQQVARVVRGVARRVRR
jgi:hypothetical protein